MPAGRPFGTFKYDNLGDLEKGIDTYFTEQDKKDKPYTLEGLALALNISVKTLWNYGKEGYGNPEYLQAINRARERCMNYAAERLYDKNGSNGAKFYMTNNAERMGGLRYSDRQEMAVTADVTPDLDTLNTRIKDLLAELTPEEKAALTND